MWCVRRPWTGGYPARRQVDKFTRPGSLPTCTVQILIGKKEEHQCTSPVECPDGYVLFDVHNESPRPRYQIYGHFLVHTSTRRGSLLVAKAGAGKSRSQRSLLSIKSKTASTTQLPGAEGAASPASAVEPMEMNLLMAAGSASSLSTEALVTGVAARASMKPCFKVSVPQARASVFLGGLINPGLCGLVYSLRLSRLVWAYYMSRGSNSYLS